MSGGDRPGTGHRTDGGVASEIDRIAELAKRRGFFIQTASVYGGVGGF